MMTGNGVMHNGTTILDEYGHNLDRLKASRGKPREREKFTARRKDWKKVWHQMWGHRTGFKKEQSRAAVWQGQASQRLKQASLEMPR